jgi:hypothetical protein
MDMLLNNKVSNTILSSEYALSASIALLTMIIMIFFLYNEIYGEKECGSHLDKIVKAGVVSGGVACLLTYLYKQKGHEEATTCIYAGLE